jgi:signal transduction histidine kinase/CheY-like chemotaxis protein
MKISQKIPILVVISAVLTGTLITVVSYFKAKEDSVKEIETRIESVVSSKKAAFENYLESIAEDVRFHSSNPLVVAAIEDFSEAINKLGVKDESLSNLHNKFIADASTNQLELITYTHSHNKYHQVFTKLAKEKGYYDIFLINKEGDVVYTVQKEVDFATNLIKGKWKGNSVAKVFELAKNNKDHNHIAFADFAPYEPSNNDPASFIASSVFDDQGNFVGVIAFHMPIERLVKIIQVRSGLGKTGKTYLAGKGFVVKESNNLRDSQPIVEWVTIQNQAVKLGLSEKNGILHNINGLRGEDSMAVFASIDFLDTSWVLVAEIAESEIMEPILEMRNDDFVTLFIICGLVGIIGVIAARHISDPLFKLINAMKKLENSETDIQIPYLGRKDEIGKIAAALESFRITAIKAEIISQELIEARNRAENYSHAKSEFLINMSHELRTPMNAILGLSTILIQDDTVTERQKKFLVTLHSSAEALLNLINDMLDISKIETNKVILDRIEFNLEELVNNIGEMVAIKIKEKGLKLNINYDHSLPKYFYGDPTRIRQVITNIIENAIKFTDKGRIILDTIFKERKEKEILVEIRIKDTGIGINKENLENVFDKFVQVDSSVSKKYFGMGLGLAICRGLAELMNGSIEVKSQIGKGSTFILTLPLEKSSTVLNIPQTQELEQDENTISSDKPKILLVEDYYPNVMVVESLLESYGYDLDTAECGEEALQKVRKDNYSLILMDIQMQGMDGFEVTKYIREYERYKNKHVPIIALTAHAVKGYEEKCIKAGMNGYISKPFKPTELKQKIDSYL